MRCLYVGNIAFTVDETRLEAFASGFGDVEKVAIPRREDGASKGFAFITFRNEDDADRARRCLDGETWEGRRMIANWSFYPSPEEAQRARACK